MSYQPQPPLAPYFWLQNGTPNSQSQANAPREEDPLVGLETPSLLATISALATRVFQSVFVKALFCGCLSYLLCRLVKKLLAGYTFIRKIEEMGLMIVRSIPYLHIFALVVTVAFSWYMPVGSYAVMAGVGVLSGITIDVDPQGPLGW